MSQPQEQQQNQPQPHQQQQHHHLHPQNHPPRQAVPDHGTLRRDDTGQLDTGAPSVSSASTISTVSAPSGVPAATSGSATVTAARMTLPTAAQRRRARELATVLLTLATCQGCSRPVQDPVTLPCGHSACMQCVKDRVMPRTVPAAEDDVVPLPCFTHLPPRLPLSPSTVPCPVSGCPRSAIGRGIGVWAGHLPRYGLIPTFTERLPVAGQDVGPGAPPVDGFVVGVADHPHQLTVIGPQTRSKAHLFAMSPYGIETGSAASQAVSPDSLLPSLTNSNLLRTDVTLSKAVAILRRYASSPLPRPPRTRRSALSASLARSRAARRVRPGAESSRGNRSVGARSRAGTSGRLSHDGAAASSRGRASQAGMGIFGMNESDLESGTVGGVQAAESDSDEADDFGCSCDEGDHHHHHHHHHHPTSHPQQDDDRDAWVSYAGADEEHEESEDEQLWPDLVGGAFSRPPATVSGSSITAGQARGGARGDRDAKLKRRRGRRSTGQSSSPTTASVAESKVARTDGALLDPASRQADSGWTTEDSAISAAGSTLDTAVQAGNEVANTTNAAHVHAHAVGLPGPSPLGHPTSDEASLAKHSLALSTKTGPNGEPMIQSVATLHSELLENLECQLCYLLLYQPLTTPCGHTFCKPCFARSLDHGNRCPLCRADMPNFSFFQDHAPNSSLLKILTADTATFSDEELDSDSAQETFAGLSIPLQRNADGSFSRTATQPGRLQNLDDEDPDTSPHHYGFKRLYEQRKMAIEQEEREARLSTPIFVCTLAFPGMPTILHIFEPRYRLMVRRCLESGNPRFGMVLPSRVNGGTEEYGTMLEIKSVQMLADGRSMLETVGSYRFKLLEKGSLDGYTVGRVERVDDIPLEEEAELERAAMRRRADLDRREAERKHEAASASAPGASGSSSFDEKADEAARRSCQTSRSSTPHMQHASASSGSTAAAAAASAPSENIDADPLSLYRSREATVSTIADDNASTTSSSQHDRHGQPEREHDDGGLSPFQPVPAEPSMQELIDICTSFIETLRSGSAPWLLSRLNHTYGPMPGAHEVERLGYWMALVMPIDEHEKAKLLPIRSRRLRLCLVVHWIEQLRQSWWFNSGCTVS
ncbi:hypothetical protein BCV70DRAFT_163767 [Testicularia cyperi]|uniref:RING-type domain-containing protein n=1 Tax=Testicularia cyperi TaxID=1882483 RepID=A0A317XMB2_9BASI|nr:hypothetical protein BCV70DRAFT_163767 [Testicularia cyperi]